MGLRRKFNRAMLVGFAIGLAIAGWVSWHILQGGARAEVQQNARMMMEAGLAIRAYTVAEVRPLLSEKMATEFLPQSVPAYSATRNLRMLREKFPEYVYKEAAINPTNPENRATDWENQIIQYFRDHPGEEELVAERDSPTGAALTLSRPMQIESKGCLACHGRPEEAPPTLIAKYGSANGFGWKEGEVIGAQIVSIPMSVPLGRASKTFLVFMGSLIGVFALLFLLLNLFLHFIVIRPVNRMAQIASDVSMGKADVPEFARKGEDEIASLSVSFNRMRRSLENALKMIEGEESAR